MTLHISEAQAHKLAANLNHPTLPYNAPKRRRATTHTTQPRSSNPESLQRHTGLFGSTLHRWIYTARVDGWVSVCGRVQRNGKPVDGPGVECVRCFEEVQE